VLFAAAANKGGQRKSRSQDYLVLHEKPSGLKRRLHGRPGAESFLEQDPVVFRDTDSRTRISRMEMEKACRWLAAEANGQAVGAPARISSDRG
jgi:hypothetical protein